MWYVLLSIAVIARCWDRPPTNNITNNTTTSSSPSAAAHRITYTTCIYKRSWHRNYVGRARSGCPTSLGAVTFDAWSRAIEPNIPYRLPDNDIPAFILIPVPRAIYGGYWIFIQIYASPSCSIWFVWRSSRAFNAKSPAPVFIRVYGTIYKKSQARHGSYDNFIQPDSKRIFNDIIFKDKDARVLFCIYEYIVVCLRERRPRKRARWIGLANIPFPAWEVLPHIVCGKGKPDFFFIPTHSQEKCFCLRMVFGGGAKKCYRIFCILEHKIGWSRLCTIFTLLYWANISDFIVEPRNKAVEIENIFTARSTWQIQYARW